MNLLGESTSAAHGPPKLIKRTTFLFFPPSTHTAGQSPCLPPTAKVFTGVAVGRRPHCSYHAGRRFVRSSHHHHERVRSEDYSLPRSTLAGSDSNLSSDTPERRTNVRFSCPEISFEGGLRVVGCLGYVAGVDFAHYTPHTGHRLLS